MRLFSLGEKHRVWFYPYKDTDTSKFVTKNVTTMDTAFSVRIRKNDPIAIRKLDHFIMKGYMPPNPAHVDSLFKRYMDEHHVPVKASHVKYFNLKKNRKLAEDDVMPEYGMESDVFPIDILEEAGLKAYTNVSVIVLFQPFMFELIILTILTLIELYCISWLLRNMIRKHRTSLRLGRLIEKMSRDIQKPLMISTVTINDLSEPVIFKNWEDEVKTTESVTNELNRVNFYIDEILAIIHQEEHPAIFAKEKIQLYPVFAELQKQYEGITAKKVVVKIVSDPKIVLYVNKIHFLNIMESLMNNAVMFSDNPVHIELDAYSEEDCTTVIVQDDGWGIPEDDLERVFHKFYKVQSHQDRLHTKGYGMGLAYVKTVVRAMGGDVLLDSVEHDHTEAVMVFSNSPASDQESRYFERLGKNRIYRDVKSMHGYFSIVFDMHNWELVEIRVEPQEGPDDPCDPSVIQISARPRNTINASIPYFVFEYYYDVRFLRMEKNLHIFAVLKEKDPYFAERANARYAKYMLQNNFNNN